ncbi:unnamed protein product [Bursaphelenchus okinawaensis]|uniref:Uncharacterized protein n=1 Tax=Bursaphelenchus okinawaensis TaxID=465554 RepID=A0A811K8P5_9BILA|nr:unnamed protein product [Bursaphelenchus okinawaensis]CAG9095934.1 unnamed protein product [Bursaphelenchus okinawaensis]
MTYEIPEEAVLKFETTALCCFIQCGVETTKMEMSWKPATLRLYDYDQIMLVDLVYQKVRITHFLFEHDRISVSRKVHRLIYFARNMQDYGLVAVGLRFEDEHTFLKVVGFYKRALQVAGRLNLNFGYICLCDDKIELPEILQDLVQAGPASIFTTAMNELKAKKAAKERSTSSSSNQI